MRQTAAADSEQLRLEIETRPSAALPYRIRPMTPLAGDAPFDDPDWFFEPWWPGASALAYIAGGHLRLQTEHLADPLAAFPELRDLGFYFTDDRLVVEGALLVLDEDGRPDADLLRQRLASPRSRGGLPAFVASDLLYERGQPLLSRPFEERRRRLAAQAIDGDRCVISRGIRGEGVTLAEAVSSMGIGEISARLLTGPYRPGVQDESWLRLPVVETPAAPTRPLLALLQKLPL